MSSLEQNISRYKQFDSDLRELITNDGGTIPSGTTCEGLLPIIDNLIPAPVYGVSGMYSSSPALTRTDDSVGLGFSVNSVSGEVDSDFDNVFPWNMAEVVYLESGKFLKMPRMYFRVGVDNESRITDIAVSKHPDSEGNWYMVEEFYYGCYGASVENSKLASRSGVERKCRINRTNFRAYAKNCGNGYCQLDLYHRTVMMFLWFIEFATKDSRAVMTGRISGSGTAGGSSKCMTGGTDSVTTPSGYDTVYGQMRYHFIEDFIGNVQEFVDGVAASPINTADYVTDDPENFSDEITGMTQLSYPSPPGGCLAALGWDSGKPFLCMPHTVVNNTNYDTYFCDTAFNSSDSRHVLSCGSFYTNAGHGIAYYNRVYAGSNAEAIGGRLIKVSL